MPIEISLRTFRFPPYRQTKKFAVENDNGCCNHMLQHPCCVGLKGKPALFLFLQHLDHARKILPAVPRNAMRRVNGAGHAAQRGAGFHGCGVFLG